METGNRAPPDNLLSAQMLGTAQAQGRATSLFPSASPSPEGLLSSQREEAGRKADAAERSSRSLVAKLSPWP